MTSPNRRSARDRRLLALADRVIRPVLTNSRVERAIGHPCCTLRYTGRVSGAPVELTVWYQRTDDGVDVDVGLPDRKAWWRNFRGAGHPVHVQIDGVSRSGHGVAVGEPPGPVRVHIRWRD